MGAMKFSRCISLSVSLAAASASAEPQPKRAAEEVRTFAEIAAAVGWTDKTENAFCFAQATDLHVEDRGPLGIKDKFAGRSFLTDINALDPSPAFLAITGDVISDSFRDKSSWPRARREFENVRRILGNLREDIPYHLNVGNNDCAWEMFQEVWPERPLYWSFDHGGIHFVGLMEYNTWKPENGNHAGEVLDAEQLAWLERDLAGRSKQTLVLFTHAPLCDANANLLRLQVEPLLKDWSGDVWNIAGHSHGSRHNLRRLPKTTMRIVQTSTPVGAWRVNDGVYRLFFAAEGRILGTALRRLTSEGEPIGFAPVAPEAKWEVFTPLFEAVADRLLWSVDVGANDMSWRVAVSNTQDRLSSLYVRGGGYAIYRLPQEVLERKPADILLSASAKCNLAFSPDAKTWRPVEIRNEKIEGTEVVLASLPARPADATYIRFSPADEGGIDTKARARIYGIGLLETEVRQQP